MTPEGPGLPPLPRDGEGVLSGPGKPNRTWPGPLCAQFNRLGWSETTALASPASRSPRVSVTPQRKSEPWMLSGAHKTVTRGGQDLTVRDCSTLSHSSRDFLGVSCRDFPIFWPFWTLWPPSRGPRSVWLSQFWVLSWAGAGAQCRVLSRSGRRVEGG